MRAFATVTMIVAALGAVSAVGLTAAAYPASSPIPIAAAQKLSGEAIGEDQGWKALVEAPGRSDVSPVNAVRASGEVADPQALVHPAAGRKTTLYYPAGGKAPVLILDYGQEVGGIATFDVASTSRDELIVSYAEQVDDLTHKGDGAATPGPLRTGNPARSEVLAASAAGTVASPEIQGGERYERVTLSAPGRVVLRSAGIQITAPISTASSLAGYFLSSDELLNRVWYAGVYTLNLDQLAPGTTTIPGSVDQLHLILDGAKRDRAVWSADQLIADMTDYYALGESSYVRDTLGLLGDHPASTAGKLTPAAGQESVPGPLPGVCSTDLDQTFVCGSYSASYSMVFVPALYQYYLYTGDLAFVSQQWPSVVRQMQWDAQQLDANGLFAVSAADGWDWDLEDASGELSYVNAIYYQTLIAASRLASAIGDSSDAQSYLAGAAQIAAALNSKLWDARTGVYDASTTDRGPIVQDANVTAVLAGIPSASRAHEILNVLTSALRSPFGLVNVASPVPAGYTQVISPYIGGLQLDAELEHGMTDDALALIGTEWGWMIDHDPGGVDWEQIQTNGTLGPVASAAHSWSTGPTPALSQYVLGIAPVTAGYASWSIAPQVRNLQWAQGTVPTPHGPITARWRRETGRTSSFRLTVEAPAGTSGSVSVPLLDAARVIAQDGHIVWNGQRAVNGAQASLSNGSVVFSDVTGAHTYAW